MRRRGRAVAFASAAAICAGLAAGATRTPTDDLASQGGELRDVLVASRTLKARERLRAAALDRAVEIRRVPESFLPPDALASPEQVAGRRPAVTIPAGSYVLASELAQPEPAQRPPRAAADPGRRAVEITVTGAAPLAAGGRSVRQVDVVVTTEPGPGGGRGRTYVAAAGVELLDLRTAGEAGGGDPLDATGEPWVATLGLTRDEALRLIQAESFARAVRLIER